MDDSELRRKMEGRMELSLGNQVVKDGTPDEKLARTHEIIDELHEHWGDGFEGISVNILLTSAIVGAIQELTAEVKELTRMMVEK